MTTTEKLECVKALLKITDTTYDAELTVYLSFAKDEIISWLYSGKPPDNLSDVPAQYEPTQIMAVIAGFSQSGAEGQLAHSENGISRTWKYEDMVAYIRSHVCAYVQVI